MLSNRNIEKLKENGLGFTIHKTREYRETYRDCTGGVITSTTIYDLSNEDRKISLLKDTGGYLSICGPMFEALLFGKPKRDVRWFLEEEDQMIDDIILEFFPPKSSKKSKKYWKKRAKSFQKEYDNLKHEYDMLQINFTAFEENVQQLEEMFEEQKLLKEELAKRVSYLKSLNNQYKNANLNLQIKLEDLKDDYDTLRDCSDAEKARWDEHYAQISSNISILYDDIKDLDLPEDNPIVLNMKYLMSII
jgi:DNA repair exonuclease SbcCD ATPase subunit